MHGDHIAAWLHDVRSRNLLLPIWYEGGAIRIIDQRELPHHKVIVRIDHVNDLISSIQNMAIRGSGALGLCGAWGVFLAANEFAGRVEAVLAAARSLREARPTAFNLHRTVDELVPLVTNAEDTMEDLESQVLEIVERQLSYEYKLAEEGAKLLHEGDSILTHCHSGALAGAGYGGRVISVLRRAVETGKKIHVFVSETRPYLQGARITAWELGKLGIPYTVITDGTSGYCMQQRLVNLVLVGSDRVAANGDVANKIGTYTHAVLAAAHHVPFYVATSEHTIDLSLATGTQIPIEMRPMEEIMHLGERLLTPPDATALYPAFDITPAGLIAGIITEKGVLKPPYEASVAAQFGRHYGCEGSEQER